MLNRHRRRLGFRKRFSSTPRRRVVRRRFAESTTSPFEASFQLRDWWDAFLEEYGEDYYSFQPSTLMTILEEDPKAVILQIVSDLMDDRSVEFDYPTTKGPMDFLLRAAIVNVIVESDEFKEAKERANYNLKG